jgi:hypothetical protein
LTFILGAKAEKLKKLKSRKLKVGKQKRVKITHSSRRHLTDFSFQLLSSPPAATRAYIPHHTHDILDFNCQFVNGLIQNNSDDAHPTQY